jgi:hypothetical protein
LDGNTGKIDCPSFSTLTTKSEMYVFNVFIVLF